MSRLIVVLGLLAASLALAVAIDNRRFWKYNDDKRYNYYVGYFYYRDGFYPNNPGNWFQSYVREYQNNYRRWYGGRGEGIRGFKFGKESKYNFGASKYSNSWGGYIYFNSYFDAYNFFWNEKYGLYSGWYNKGNFNYQSGFKGEVPFTSSDTTGRSTSAPQDASGFALRGTDVLPAPSDLSTLL
jgi:hypothetical protein